MDTEVMLREVNLTTNTKLFERTTMNYEEIESMVEYFDSTKDAHEDTKGFIEYNSQCFEYLNYEGNRILMYLMNFLIL